MKRRPIGFAAATAFFLLLAAAASADAGPPPSDGLALETSPAGVTHQLCETLWSFDLDRHPDLYLTVGSVTVQVGADPQLGVYLAEDKFGEPGALLVRGDPHHYWGYATLSVFHGEYALQVRWNGGWVCGSRVRADLRLHEVQAFNSYWPEDRPGEFHIDVVDEEPTVGIASLRYRVRDPNGWSDWRLAALNSDRSWCYNGFPGGRCYWEFITDPLYPEYRGKRIVIEAEATDNVGRSVHATHSVDWR